MIKEVYKELDAMTAEQREKMLYFIIPLYAMERYPEAVTEALEIDIPYTSGDIRTFKRILSLMK